jgi:transposase
MVAPSVRYVVGVDVAKRAHVCCVLEAATAKVCVRAQSVPATAEGYGHLVALLGQYGAPATVLVGLEATGCLWEPLYAALDRAGYPVLVLNPRQTAAWAAALGLRAKTDEIDALTLARGLLAGYGQAGTLPSETVQALRTLTRARHDLVQARAAAKQRLRDELVVLFPELPEHTPEGCDLFAPGLLRLLRAYPSAQAIAQAKPAELAATLAHVSGGHWTAAHAAALQALAQHSAASPRAVGARSVVLRTMAHHLLDLQQRIAELETAIEAALAEDQDGQTLEHLWGLGPIHAATIRAELGDVRRFSHVDQVVAYAGLEPRTVKSGSFVGQKHLSKRGPGALRHTLYLATLVVIQRCPTWQARYQRLVDRGRAKKEALTILSRALLKQIYHLLRTGSPADPTLLKPCWAPSTA